MRQVSNHQFKHKWQNFNWFKTEASEDLRRWGYIKRREIYQESRPRCTLPNLIEYGISMPSGYYEPIVIADPGVRHTEKVLALFPEHIFTVIYVGYALDISQEQKAMLLDLTRSKFRTSLKNAIKLYCEVRDNPIFV